jgi:hypothetical protein
MSVFVVVCVVLVFGTAVWAAEDPQAPDTKIRQPIATEQIGSSHLLIEPNAGFEKAILSVTGPAGYELRQIFFNNGQVHANLMKGRLARVEDPMPDLPEKAAPAVSLEGVTNETYQASPMKPMGVMDGSAPVKAEEGMLFLPDGRYKYEVRFLKGGLEQGVFSGLFFVEDGVAVSRATVRERMAGTRRDLAAESTADADAPPTKGASIATDWATIIDGTNDGTTVLALDSDYPSGSQYVDMSNVYGDISFGAGSGWTNPNPSLVTISRFGAVGIGTTNPGGSLELHSTLPEIEWEDTSTGQEWRLEMFPGDNMQFWDITGGTYPFRIENGAPTGTLHVDSTGQVGVGISNPTGKLHVEGSMNGLKLATGLSHVRTTTDTQSTFFRTQTTTSTETAPLWLMHDAPSGLLALTASGLGITDGGWGITPTAPLHVVKSPAGGTAALVENGAHEVRRTDGGQANVRFQVANATITQSWLFMLNGTNGTFEIRNETGTSTPFGIRANAPVSSIVASAAGVGIRRSAAITHPLHMGSGAHVTAGGVWTNSSSRALKDGIHDLTSDEAMSALDELQPVLFHYKNSPDEEYAGFIAEDVPDVVATNDRESLSPMDLVAVLTKVVQDQQTTIEDLTARIEELEQR